MFLQKIAEMVAKIVLTEIVSKIDQAIERQIKIELTVNPDHRLEEIAKKAVMEIINDVKFPVHMNEMTKEDFKSHYTGVSSDPRKFNDLVSDKFTFPLNAPNQHGISRKYLDSKMEIDGYAKQYSRITGLDNLQIGIKTNE